MHAVFKKRKKLGRELEALDTKIYKVLSPVVMKFLRKWWEGSYGAPVHEFLEGVQKYYPRATESDVMRVIERMEAVGRLERKKGYYDRGGTYYRIRER